MNLRAVIHPIMPPTLYHVDDVFSGAQWVDPTPFLDAHNCYITLLDVNATVSFTNKLCSNSLEIHWIHSQHYHPKF